MEAEVQPPALPNGLFFHQITKSFGGTLALNNVTMNVGRGEIVALLGENGAGKSTLIKILGGIHTPDSGSVVIDRTPYRHTPGSTQVRQAVAFIHQDLGLIEWMSIAENMALAQGFQRRGGLIDWRACERHTTTALQRVGCDFSPSMRVSRLTRAEKSLVAIARALAVDCDFLVLDEPTASLPADDVEKLFSVLQNLRDDGVGMIYVSHRLDEVFQLSDRVVVLRDGETVGVRSVAHTSPEELVDLIVGSKPKTFDKLAPTDRTPLLSIRNLCTEHTGPISLDVNNGEVLGLVGLRGAGQEDIGRCLFGTATFEGEITLEGSVFKPQSPQDAMRRGIGLIPRDRVVESVATGMSVRENLYLNPGALGRGLLSFMTRSRERHKAIEAGVDVGLRPNNPDLPIDALSGGNQQKVIVGRWLTTNNKVLIAEDPTAGVDVGAKAEIYTLLNEMVVSGVPVIVISTDFEEVATLCNRAIIFNRGLCIQELQGIQLTTEALVQAASASDYQAQA
ncbi:sugar ABC transporter ATP-binding protein [Granulosicoccus sp. 3-233]|uniref:sugar ABC transporter ATP-binding protein n=1 Tax=Granulosicoccus sp. 3-233 TaxID=3417969 RepID=UPI003D354011